MSRIGATTQVGGSGGAGIVSLEAKGLEVLEQLGYLPDALTGALRVRVLDLVAHHRSTVGKHVGREFPGKRAAQKFWFARTFQYSKKAGSIGQIGGESFAVGIEGAEQADELWSSLEVGRVLVAGGKGRFAIPFLDGRGRRLFEATDKIGKDTYKINKLGYLIRDGVASKKAGEHTVVAGVLRRSRKQRKLLKFFDAFGEIAPRHNQAIDKIFDQALTAAGQVTLKQQTALLEDRLFGRITRKKSGPQALTAGQVLAATIKLNPLVKLT